MKKLAIALLAAFCGAQNANAQSGPPSNTNAFGPISMVYGSTSGGMSFVVTVSTRSAVPPCATPNPTRFEINTTTPAGQAMTALLLSAWSMKKRIWVQGTGTCSITSNIETVAYFNPED